MSDVRRLLELHLSERLRRVVIWNESAGVYGRVEGDQLRYMDTDLHRHK